MREGKRRAEGEVKREAEEAETTPAPRGGEGDVTLAHLSLSLLPAATSPRAKPRPFPSASEIPSGMKRTGKRVKVLRRYSNFSNQAPVSKPSLRKMVHVLHQMSRHLPPDVYVIRANALNEVDGALGLFNLDASQKQIDAELGKNR